MYKSIPLAAVLLLLGHAAVANPTLAGTWREPKGQTAIGIAPCPDAAESMCVTLLEDRDPAGARRIGQVVAELKPLRANRWRGEFVTEAGARLPMEVVQDGPGAFTYEVCALPGFCDRGRYARAASL